LSGLKSALWRTRRMRIMQTGCFCAAFDGGKGSPGVTGAREPGNGTLLCSPMLA